MSKFKSLITSHHVVIVAEFPYCDASGRPVLYDETTGREVPIDPVTKKHRGAGAYRYEKNYFVGITHQQVPGKAVKLFMNVWTVHFKDLEIGAGVFLPGEADEWIKKIGLNDLRVIKYYDEHPKNFTRVAN